MIPENQLQKAAAYSRTLSWAAWGIIALLAASIILYFVSLRTSGQFTVYFSPRPNVIFLIFGLTSLKYAQSLYQMSKNNLPTLKFLQINLYAYYCVMVFVIIDYIFRAMQLINYSSLGGNLPYYSILLFIINVIVIVGFVVLNVIALKWALSTIKRE